MSAVPGQCMANSVGAVNSLTSLLFQSLLMAQCQISPVSLWPPDYGAEVLKNGWLEEFDFVVIGAGSAGSVLGGELSKDPKRNVLVLEAGKNPPQESEIVNLFLSLQNTQYCHNTLTQSNGLSCKASKDGQCMSGRGNVLGGTGSINGMLYLRGNPNDYDEWLAAGNEGWGYNDVSAVFDTLERRVGTKSHPQGYVHIEPYHQYDADVMQVIYEAGKQLGVPKVEDFLGETHIGYGQVKGTIQNGRRASTAKMFLGNLQKRPNLKVITEAAVKKLKFNDQGTKVVGIEFEVEGKHTLTVSAKKEVILSAGTIGTPQILMRSGVGPKEVLESLNVTVVRDLPIGENFQDHVIGAFFIVLSSQDDKQADPITNQFYQYLQTSSGPLSSVGISSFVGLINTNSSKKSLYPNTGLYHYLTHRNDTNGIISFAQAFSMNEEVLLYFLKTIRDHHILRVYVTCLHPKSRGSVKLDSLSLSADPIINANYLSHPEDLETLKDGANFVKNLVNTDAFQARNAQIMRIPIPECDAYEFMSDEYWRCYVSYYSTSGYHYAGTVKMGSKKDETACVDPQLKLKGFDNLRVADASIMPFVTSANTNGPTIMIAKKGADMISEQWKQENLI